MVNNRRIYIAFGLVLASSVVQALDIQTWQQNSGVQVFHVNSPSLPMVDVQIDFDAGSRLEPAAQAGLADATASLMAAGVPAKGQQPALDENQLGEAWADLGAGFSASAGQDRFSVSLRSLTEPKLLAPAVALAARQLGEASFPEAVWQRDRARWQARIRESLTRPGTVAGLAYTQALYGQHPYGKITTEASLSAISVADMRSWRDRQLQPCRAKATVVGAVTREQADQLVSRLLADLPALKTGACSPAVSTPAVPPLAKAQQQEIPFQAAQAQVLIGQPGYARSDSRHFAYMVGNHILGEGFTSRLMKEVREKRGLSYSVGSNFSVAREGGSFTISLQTKPEQAEQAKAVALAVLRDFVAQGPTDAEMQAAKANLSGSFALRIDSNAKLLGNVANIAWHDLPLNYLDGWTRQIEGVNREQVHEAFKSLIDPQKLVVVVLNAQPAPAAQPGDKPAEAPPKAQ